MMGNYFNSMMGGYYSGFGWVGWILNIIFWALVIALIILLIRGLFGKRRQEKSPADILKERYAKGEISKEEFQEKKKDLV